MGTIPEILTHGYVKISRRNLWSTGGTYNIEEEIVVADFNIAGVFPYNSEHIWFKGIWCDIHSMCWWFYDMDCNETTTE